jgi:hypothetical protein
MPIKQSIETIQRHKDLILSISIWVILLILFSATAGILIFKASGYAYNFETGKVQKTGLLYIRAIPSSADVYLDGKLRGGSTPLRIAGLLPGKYHLEIKRDDYKTITKNVHIYEGLATNLNPLLMFYESPRTLSTEIVDAYDSYLIEDQLLVLTKTKGLVSYLLLDSATLNQVQDPKELAYSGSALVIVSALDTNRVLLKNTRGEHFVLNLQDEELIGLSHMSQIEQIDKVELLGSNLFLMSNHDLFRFDLDSLETVLIAQEIVDFDTEKAVYAIQLDPLANLLLGINPSSLQIRTLQELQAIVSPKTVQISEDQQVAIRDTKGRLFVSSNGYTEPIATGVHNFAWSEKKNWLDFSGKYKLTYNTGGDIWVYQKNNHNLFGDLKEVRLVKHTECDPHKLGFFQNQNTLQYSCDHNLFVTDLTGTSVKLIELDNDLKYQIDADYRELIYLSGDGKVSAIRVR